MSELKLLRKGKTKDVYELSDNLLKLVFTDRVTINEAGQVDPGGNEVSDQQLPGTGRACLKMTSLIFKQLADLGIKTHMVSFDLDKNSMDVKKAAALGNGLEWVARWVGTGSFVRRYKSLACVKDGMRFPSLITEITLKDDAGGDPMIDQSSIVALGLLTEKEMQDTQKANLAVMKSLHDMFKERGLDLWDIKVEWGRDSESGQIILIDEVSPNSCRAYDLQSGKKIEGRELAERF